LNPAKPQFLPRGVEGVRRCANRHACQDSVLVAPGIEAVAANADGDVEVEPERQAARWALARQRSS
jgi:hypothetical protein